MNHLSLVLCFVSYSALSWLKNSVSQLHSNTVFICSTDDAPIPGECLGCYSLIGPFGQFEVTVPDEGHCGHGWPWPQCPLWSTEHIYQHQSCSRPIRCLGTILQTCVFGEFIEWRAISWLIIYVIYFAIVVICQKTLELWIPRSTLCSLTYLACLQFLDCNITDSNLHGRSAIAKALCPA